MRSQPPRSAGKCTDFDVAAVARPVPQPMTRSSRMFTKVLVPTDFSPGADAALACARTVAEKFGASLQLLHVMSDPVTTVMMSVEAYVPDLPELRQTMLREATARINQRLTPADRSGLRATGEAVFGADARCIVEYAAEEGADLIVMGTHGRTGMSHLLLGSVAERVIRTAPCVVMTVREGTRATTAGVAETVEAVPAY